MNVIFLLIPISLLLLGLAIAAFFWAMKHDQFDDLEGPAYSILRDERNQGPSVDRDRDRDRDRDV